RHAAGEILASILSRYKIDGKSLIVIGIARGGVIVAAPIAKKLHSELDVIAPRKLRSPHNSEDAIGAIMHDGSLYLSIAALESEKDISSKYIDMEQLEQKREACRRLCVYRPHLEEYVIKDRNVILVDDGIATGATMIAAARWIRNKEPERLIIAAPVAPKPVVERLKNEADRIETIKNPSEFIVVEQFYERFAPVSDDQIIEIVRRPP
ncbi:MAG TPA: phosphoribosyltransferase family protein, partial [Nitrososphaera sp.]|nr:phosphoribosyltransferase family protein [Nitrososphaera sp.]